MENYTQKRLNLAQEEEAGGGYSTRKNAPRLTKAKGRYRIELELDSTIMKANNPLGSKH